MKWVLIMIAFTSARHVEIAHVEFGDEPSCVAAAKDIKAAIPPGYFIGPVYFAQCYPQAKPVVCWNEKRVVVCGSPQGPATEPRRLRVEP